MIDSRDWCFRVLCRVNKGEKVCVVGDCSTLGEWDSQRCVELFTEGADIDDGEKKIWETVVSIPSVDSNGKNGRVQLSGIVFQKIPPLGSNIADPRTDLFGSYGGFERVDQGWLVKDSVVQLKLFESPLHSDPIVLWKKKYKTRGQIRVKVTPVEIEKLISYESFLTNGVDESTEADVADLRTKGLTNWPIMEVAAYLFDFYLESLSLADENPEFLGCAFVLPSSFRDNLGVTTVSITSSKHTPLGQLTVHYMVVNPIQDGNCDMIISYSRHWKDSWKGLEVGHRGAGNSYHPQPTSCANIRENTIASLKYAADNGADMVEFDVQLSKDRIPVLYHDFHTCISLKRKKGEGEEPDLLEIPIKDLTLQQLQALKVYHVKEKGLSKFLDEDFEDHQPFPTLKRALEAVPLPCGFNIEFKWTMQLLDGTYELQHPFELNQFLDLILKVVLAYADHRRIVFSCFHPDICTMLRLKQNRYPVLFLTTGVSTPHYEDMRTATIRNAVLYASSADILGINVNSEDLMRDPSQIQMVLDHNLIVFCWGDRNNDQQMIKSLKKLGLHGIIYDKIDEYNTKEVKESIFLYEDAESDSPVVTPDDTPAATSVIQAAVGHRQQEDENEESTHNGPAISFHGILGN